MTTDKIILVTGATGKTGKRVAALLREQGHRVREASRTAETRFDWADQSTWPAALADVTAIHIVAPYDDTEETLRAFSTLAVSLGAKKATLIATPSVENYDDVLGPERVIAEAGLQLTSLRPRWFHQNFSEDFLYPPILEGELRLPAGDGKEAFVDAEDIAAVAAAALVDDSHNGKVYDVSGPRVLSFAEIAEEFSRVLGREIRYVPVTADEFIAAEIENGVPEEFARMIATVYGGIASGYLNSTSDDVEKVLGRPARDFTEYVRDTARTGVWNV